MSTSTLIKMIYSINFLPMALSKLPKMFGLSELATAYFPHLYNRKDNQQVILSQLPDVEYYIPNAMKPEDRKVFLSWYAENKDNPFNIRYELVRYCCSDVDILRCCSLKFREDFMDVINIDPFEKSITISSACQRVFRTKITARIIPTHGYNPQHTQSVKALHWIKYISHCTGQHARNGGETRIGEYLVDGNYDAEEGREIVVVFHGDFWYGNPNTFASTTWNPVSKLIMGELYQRTMDKKRGTMVTVIYLSGNPTLTDSSWKMRPWQLMFDTSNWLHHYHRGMHCSEVQLKHSHYTKTLLKRKQSATIMSPLSTPSSTKQAKYRRDIRKSSQNIFKMWIRMKA